MRTIDVLFVVHEAQRSGAPTSLLRQLGWLRGNTTLSFAVVLGADGPLAAEYGELAPVVLASSGNAGDLFRQARLVYANSSWSHQIVDAATPFEAPVVSHIRELRGLLNRVNPMSAGKRPARYIAVSEEVRDILVEDYPIEPAEVTVCEGFVPTKLIEAAASAPTGLGPDAVQLPETAMVVGAVGGIWPTKGPDLFLQVAAQLVHEARTPEDPHFVWIGGPHEQLVGLRRSVRELGLDDRVHLTGELRQPYGLMRTFDVQVLPSREDAFPSVLLEAGVLGRPVVAFACSRGVRELLAHDRGVLVDPGHVRAMADEVVSLLSDGPRRSRIGSALGAHVRERHDIERRAPEILRVIESLL